MDKEAEELRAWATLLRIPGLTYERVVRALQSVASAAELLRTTLTRPGSARTHGARPDPVAAPGPETDRCRSRLARSSQAAIWYLSHRPNFRRCSRTPAARLRHSTWRARPQVLSAPQLAIVGSRNPTASGRETAFDFAAHLARCGLVITSGLAEGIDAAGHRGALAAGAAPSPCAQPGSISFTRNSTRSWPGSIAAHGALVSEFPPGTPPRRESFPQRNRIISGLSLGTLVVEAARQSGSLITARYASEQGREVFAIPGSIHSPLSRGCHRLIRDGAKLVETAEDILTELHWQPAEIAAPARARRRKQRTQPQQADWTKNTKSC